MNAPDRYTLYVLGEDEQRVTVEEDTKIPNAATFTIHKEDHTLANILRSQLLLNPHVLFCGYQVPHPLEPQFLLKVQTDSDQLTPMQAVQDAANILIDTLSKMMTQLQEQSGMARAVNDAVGDSLGAGVGLGGAYGMDDAMGLEGMQYE